MAEEAENTGGAGGAGGAERRSHADSPQLGGTAEERIRAHNQEVLRRSGDQLELVLCVLTEQRDEALRQLATADERREKQRAELCIEQERFITFLMEDHDQKVDSLNRELAAAKQELERRRALTAEPVGQHPAASGPASTPGDLGGNSAVLLEQVGSLKQLLESAQAEVEDTRADAVRLQEERDEAIRSTDDLRLELIGEVEAARDETFQLQTQLDEAFRQLEDVRDEARDEAYRASEERGEIQRELDERNEEVRRLRARLADLTSDTQPSKPPPPAALEELEAARLENRNLRKQLIDTKRELSRASREAGMARTGRGRRSGALVMRAAPGDAKGPTPSAARDVDAATSSTRDDAKPSPSGPAELRPVPTASGQTPEPASPSTQPTKPT